jgi:hypothetical protein
MSVRPEVTGRRRSGTAAASRAANSARAPPTTASTDAARSDLADNLLWGAQAIADYVGRELRPTFHLLQRGQLDADKVGAAWVTTKTRLNRQFAGSSAREAS